MYHWTLVSNTDVQKFDVTYILNPVSVWHDFGLFFLTESFHFFPPNFLKFYTDLPLNGYISLTQLSNRCGLAIWKCMPLNYGKFSFIIFFWQFPSYSLLGPSQTPQRTCFSWILNCLDCSSITLLFSPIVFLFVFLLKLLWDFYNFNLYIFISVSL